jgi:hypothetical protein
MEPWWLSCGSQPQLSHNGFPIKCQISQTMVLHATPLITLKSSESEWVHPLGLGLLGAMVWKLLIIKPFFQWKRNKNQNWKLYLNFGAFLVLLESPWRLTFNRVYFTIFRAQVWKISFLSGFCCWKFKQIAKMGLRGKISWGLNVFTLPNSQIFNSENVKK